MRNYLVGLVAVLFMASPAFAKAIVTLDALVLTESHAREIQSMLNALPARTVTYIKKVGPVQLIGGKVVLKAKNLGILSGPNDPQLNELGSAFGQDGQGNVYFRGVLAAYLIDVRKKKGFECNSVRNSGAIGYPGSVTSACVVR